MIQRKNFLVVLGILFFDIVSFSLIFPVIPKMLQYYASASANVGLEASSGAVSDEWFISLVAWLSQFQGDWVSKFHSNQQAALVIIGGLLGSIYSLLQFVANPIWGRLSDVYGRRKVLLATSFSVMSAYIIWFFSASFTMFCISRILAGFSAGNVSVCTAAVADMTQKKERTKYMGLIGAVFGLGFLFGPTIGGFAISMNIEQASHPFGALPVLSFLLSMIGVLLATFAFKETHQPDSSPSSFGRAIRNAMSTPVDTLKSLATGMQQGSKSSVIKNLFRGYFMYIFLYSCYELTFTFFFDLEFGYSPREIGLLFLYVGSVLIFTQGFLVRILRKRWPTGKILTIGLSCAPIPLFFLGTPEIPMAAVFAVLFLINIGRGLSDASFTGFATMLAGAHNQGTTLSSFRSTNALARALGPMFGGFLYFAFGPQICYMILSGLLVLHASIFLPRRPQDTME